MLAMTPRSWVMSMMELFILSLSSFKRSSICAWMVTSSAVVGSSAMMRPGEQARAMAIMTLCLMPPESSCGNML